MTNGDMIYKHKNVKCGCAGLLIRLAGSINCATVKKCCSVEIHQPWAIQSSR
ncbi:UNVERIFIED_CONTAM: hypothetical protein FKN15_004361 [Acipenser sinensis]